MVCRAASAQQGCCVAAGAGVASYLPIISETVAALMAQQGGMKFTERAWSDLLAKAKASDQIIFMDAYTTWCGPCKMMSKKVFTDKEVGDYYNTNFMQALADASIPQEEVDGGAILLLVVELVGLVKGLTRHFREIRREAKFYHDKYLQNNLVTPYP